MGSFIPHGMPFIVRNDTYLDDSGKAWRQAFPQKANIFNHLKTMPLQERITIADTINEYGADLMTAIAMFHADHLASLELGNKIDPRVKSNQVGYAGAGLGAAETRFNRFGDAAKYYQKTLEMSEKRNWRKSRVLKS